MTQYSVKMLLYTVLENLPLVVVIDLKQLKERSILSLYFLFKSEKLLKSLLSTIRAPNGEHTAYFIARNFPSPGHNPTTCQTDGYFWMLWVHS